MRKIRIILSIATSFVALQVSASTRTQLDSLLQVAIQSNDIQKVKQLLEDGANPELKFDSGLEPTPLMYASAFADGEILDMLLKQRVPLDEIDTNGDPAINWATYYGYVQNMQKLIDAGADIEIESKHGDALDVAYRLWHADSVIDVFRGTILDKSVPKETTQLIRAIRDGKISRVESMLSKGSNANVKDGLEMSALHHAVRANNIKAVSTLLNNGASPDIYNRVGQTPLTIAARFGYLDIVNLLIKKGADVNKADDEYRLTPLIAAAVSGKPEVAEVLLDAGAKLDFEDVVNQSTALHWAIFYQNNEVAKLLIDRGASYTKKCLDGQYTAYTLVIGYENKELKNYIENHRAMQNELIGSWKMNEIHYVYPDTTYKMEVLQGSLLIDEKRYSIMYNPSPRPRKAFESLSKPTEEEMLAGFRSIVFNTGPYEITDDVMLAHPDLAKVPGFEGGKQYYRYRLEGDKLFFRMYDETYPNGDKPEWYGKVEVQFILTKE
ncbi:ankyrin repeat domain-containing protein [Ekhidna sp.]|uniref:ankyrin repeat domain-containing protein n=1 Tax=Ekhidna sp. TaxID=2608089 RepID=UPI003512881C